MLCGQDARFDADCFVGLDPIGHIKAGRGERRRELARCPVAGIAGWVSIFVERRHVKVSQGNDLLLLVVNLRRCGQRQGRNGARAEHQEAEEEGSLHGLTKK